MKEVALWFGENAGKIWRILEKQGSLPANDLLKETNLNDDDFAGAVGWLARESKIAIDGKRFKLGETNLATKIGKDAGKVWKVLQIWDDADTSLISKLSRLDGKDVHAALGWLGREDKLQVIPDQTTKRINFRLK